MQTMREVLAANLKALMAYREDRSTLEKIIDASDGRLTNGTLGRIRAATHATSVDTLGELAKVFSLQPWQLLVPDLKPEALPQIAGAELLESIRSLISAQPTQAPAVSSGQAQLSGTKKPLRRLHGQNIGTGASKGKTGEVDRPEQTPRKRRGGRT